jgi:hypothetical protein
MIQGLFDYSWITSWQSVNLLPCSWLIYQRFQQLNSYGVDINLCGQWIRGDVERKGRSLVRYYPEFGCSLWGTQRKLCHDNPVGAQGAGPHEQWIEGLSFSHSVWPCIKCITNFPNNTTLKAVKMYPTDIKAFFADLLAFDLPVSRVWWILGKISWKNIKM